MFPLDQMNESGKNLVVIGCGQASQISTIANETKIPAEKIFVDPSYEIYNRFGLVRLKSFSELGGDGSVSGDSKRGAFSGVLIGIGKHLTRGEQGNPKQQGGAFMLGPGKACTFAHRDKFPEDHLKSTEVARMLGVSL
mmetsp:Transcript_17686/g.41611  ORF Transcript_17686/g.41611 Transcript_17686/m.41611 type:complete len:138 (+) Transcript_17686:178-591(+)